MLTPEYLDSCTDSLLGIYDTLNTSIVEDVARRIVKTGRVTDSAMWQIKQVQESGKLLNEITREVANMTQYTDDEIRSMFNEAGIEALSFDNRIYTQAGLETIQLAQSEAMKQLLSAQIEKTKGNINNLTMTTAAATQNMYLQATNLAYMQVSSGAFSYQEAIKQAIKAAAIDGGSVYYSNGHSSKLDVAIRRSVLTGVNQTCGQLTETYAGEMGCEYYETTAHAGARPTHSVWQGRVFKIHGSAHGYENFYDATGYGTGAGLCGWNCRHSFYPFFPGISGHAYTKSKIEEYNNKKYTYNGEQYTDYECTQMQRAFERSVRESKRILAAYNSAIASAPNETIENALKEEFSNESVKLKQTESEMKSFCSKTNRVVDSARTQVYAVKDDSGNIVNFNKSVSQKAVWANKKARG